MNLFNLIIESLFPNICAGCGSRGSIVCTVCASKFPPARTPEQPYIISVFAYSHPVVRALIRRLKYKNGRRVAGFFAPYLLSSLVEFLGEEKLFNGDVDVILVPVPISKKRMKKRGYNQSELLGNEMQKINCNEHIFLDANLVRKIKETTPQAEIKKRNMHLKNQQDCFDVLPNTYQKNEIVVLVDDVTTTGATLSAVRDRLIKNGFRKVFALTIAH